jgi:translation initiation factor 6
VQFRRLDPFGNPNVGVYVRATDRHLWVPPGITALNIADLEAALGLKAHQLTIAGSPLVGSLMAANSKGAVVADLANEFEVALLEKAGLAVGRLRHTRLNAAGNNILCNDHGAICHPDLGPAAVREIGDALGVPVRPHAIAGLPTVGTAGAATNRGVLVHPLATESDLTVIKDTLRAPVRIGTVNHGHGLVGAGLAANRNGIAVGSRTTGIELGRMDEGLGFLDVKP